MIKDNIEQIKTLDEEWDEETLKNWEEKMHEPIKVFPISK